VKSPDYNNYDWIFDSIQFDIAFAVASSTLLRGELAALG